MRLTADNHGIHAVEEKDSAIEATTKEKSLRLQASNLRHSKLA